MASRKLSDKQSRFAEEYIIDMKAGPAAIRAGYAEKGAGVQGHHLLKNPKVRARINELRAEQQQRVKVDADYVLNTIVDVMERCRQVRAVTDANGDPVLVETPSGERVPAFTFDAANALKGADMLAKHVGLYEKDNNQKNPLTEFLESLSGRASLLDAARER